jgi:hypothetical protein
MKGTYYCLMITEDMQFGKQIFPRTRGHDPSLTAVQIGYLLIVRYYVYYSSFSIHNRHPELNKNGNCKLINASEICRGDEPKVILVAILSIKKCRCRQEEYFGNQ